MNKKYITWIVAIIVIVGLVGVFSNQGVPQPASAPATNTSVETPAINTEQSSAAATNVTGNVDDAVAAILSDIDSDESPVAESDPSILSENDAAITDFGQSAGEQIQ